MLITYFLLGLAAAAAHSDFGVSFRAQNFEKTVQNIDILNHQRAKRLVTGYLVPQNQTSHHQTWGSTNITRDLVANTTRFMPNGTRPSNNNVRVIYPGQPGYVVPSNNTSGFTRFPLQPYGGMTNVSTQNYVNPGQNYNTNMTRPGFPNYSNINVMPVNNNNNTLNPVTPGYTPYPGYNTGYPGYPAPNTVYPAPNNGYPAPNTGYQGPNTGYPAPNVYPTPNTGYPASNTGFPAPSNVFPAPNTGFAAPSQNTSYPIPYTGYPIPNTGYPIPNSSYPIPNTGYPIPNTGYPIPNTGYSIPNSSYPIPNNGYPRPNTSYPLPNNGYQNPNTFYPVPNAYPTPNNGYTAPNTGLNNTATLADCKCSLPRANSTITKEERTMDACMIACNNCPSGMKMSSFGICVKDEDYDY